MDPMPVSCLVNVKRCFLCHRNAENYCVSCKNDLCKVCKEAHVISLDTKHHDVKIYRERYKKPFRNGICLMHPDQFYKKYCKTCDVPICNSCNEHGHHQHEIIYMKRAYLEKLGKSKSLINRIRGDTLYSAEIMLAKLKSHIRNCQREIGFCRSDMIMQGQRLEDLINNMLLNAKGKQKCLTLKILLAKGIDRIQNYEQRYEQSANRPVEFLRFINTFQLPHSKDVVSIQLSDVIELLGDIKIKGRGKQHTGSHGLMKLMPSPVLQNTFNAEDGCTICYFTPERSWMSDTSTMKLVDTKSGKILRSMDIRQIGTMRNPGVCTVNRECELIYINKTYNIMKLAHNFSTPVQLIEIVQSVNQPQCLHYSLSTMDLLVGMFKPLTDQSQIHRYNKFGKLTQIIHNKGQKLYRDLICITENNNGDVVVSDFLLCSVVVTERGGRHRFSYTPQWPFFPDGICTDVLSNILVNEPIKGVVHMIDKDGQFLKFILTDKSPLLCVPYRLSYDETTHLLSITDEFNSAFVYRYIDRYQAEDPMTITNIVNIKKCLCQGHTEYHCVSCRRDLCRYCKEKHVINLETKNHYVVLYREKFRYCYKQEKCLRHRSQHLNKYCEPCMAPLCDSCFEHCPQSPLNCNTSEFNEHKVTFLSTAYRTNRRKSRYKLKHIGSETLYRKQLVLKEMKSDVINCRVNVKNTQSTIESKAKQFKDLIESLQKEHMENAKHMPRWFSQKELMTAFISAIQNFEHTFEQSANRPVQFLQFIKKVRLPEIKNTPNLPLHYQFLLTQDINLHKLTELLSAMKITKREKNYTENEISLRILSPPLFKKSFTANGVSLCFQISAVSLDRVWISEKRRIHFVDIKTGNTIGHVFETCPFMPNSHTVSKECELIFIAKDLNIIKFSLDRKFAKVIEYTPSEWKPNVVYSSPSTGDILVGMWTSPNDMYEVFSSKILRYNQFGQYVQTIEYDNENKKLYSLCSFITENKNGDIVASDMDRVVVTDSEGKHRFYYKINPMGICTDVLSNILICDWYAEKIEIIDKDGKFLSILLKEIKKPQSLSYDSVNHLLYIGSLDNNTVSVYRHLYRHFDFMDENKNGDKVDVQQKKE